MKVSLCTISFRHHLPSIRAIARIAQGYEFDGIELWGMRAISDLDPRLIQVTRNA